MRAGKARALLFLAGVAAVAGGLRIARDRGQVEFALAGGAVAAAGAVLAAVAARGLPGRTPRDFNLPVPFRPIDRWSAVLILAAAGCIGWLAWQLIHVGYSNLQLFLFFGGISLGGVAFHRLDGGPPHSLPLDRLDLVLVAGLAALTCGLNMIRLTHWSFTAVGDEGEFFRLAKAISQASYRWNPFNLAGVYGDHPVLDSLIQAAGMKAFGVDAFGWRMAEVLVVAASTALVYVLARILIGRVAAACAGLVLGCSHYLMSFTRIAYNNNHCVLFCLLAMTMFTLAWRTQRTLWLFWAGCSMGLCLYTFPAALLIWPLIFALWAIDAFRRLAWAPLVSGVILLVGLGMVVTPGIASTGIAHLSVLFIQHGPREVPWQPAPWLTSSIGLMHSALAFFVNERWFHHFMAGPLLDTVTGIGLWVGLFISVFRLDRTAERLAVVWFCGGLVLIAYTSYSPQPFFTRLMFVLPAVALLAGVFAEAMATVLTESLALRRAWAWTPVGLALATIPALNLHQLLVVGPSRLVTNPETLTRKILHEHPASVVTEVCERPNDVRQLFLSMYPREEARFRFSTVAAVENPPRQEGPDGRFPIYLVHDPALVRPLREKLGEAYRTEDEWDGAHETHAVVFLPRP